MLSNILWGHGGVLWQMGKLRLSESYEKLTCTLTAKKRLYAGLAFLQNHEYGAMG